MIKIKSLGKRREEGIGERENSERKRKRGKEREWWKRKRKVGGRERSGGRVGKREGGGDREIGGRTREGLRVK